MNRTRFMLLALSLTLWAVVSLPDAARSETAETTLPEACRQLPSDGDCKALLIIAYYDVDRNACDEAFYGGCGGVVPFQELSDCRAACETGEALRLVQFRKISDLSQARLKVSYPRHWGNLQLRARVNDREAEFQVVGSSSMRDHELREVLVDLGSDAPRKIGLETTFKGRVYGAFTNVHW